MDCNAMRHGLHDFSWAANGISFILTSSNKTCGIIMNLSLMQVFKRPMSFILHEVTKHPKPTDFTAHVKESTSGCDLKFLSDVYIPDL